jgi:hypothetical protein
VGINAMSKIMIPTAANFLVALKMSRVASNISAMPLSILIVDGQGK